MCDSNISLQSLIAYVETFLHFTYFLSQWAAVSTMSFLIRNPPQMCSPLCCTEAMYGNEFGGTSLPLIIVPPSAYTEKQKQFVIKIGKPENKPNIHFIICTKFC